MEIYCWAHAWCFGTCVVWQHAFLFLLRALRGPKWYCALQCESLFICRLKAAAVMAPHRPCCTPASPHAACPTAGLSRWVVADDYSHFLSETWGSHQVCLLLLANELPLLPPCGSFFGAAGALPILGNNRKTFSLCNTLSWSQYSCMACRQPLQHVILGILPKQVHTMGQFLGQACVQADPDENCCLRWMRRYLRPCGFLKCSVRASSSGATWSSQSNILGPREGQVFSFGCTCCYGLFGHPNRSAGQSALRDVSLGWSVCMRQL